MSRFIFWALIALVALAPLPLASNRPAPWSALAIATGLLLALWALTAFRQRAPGARVADRFLLPVGLLFCAGIAWMVLETTGPLPGEWRPPAMERAASLLETAPQHGIGLDRSGAWHVVMRLLTYGGVFVLAWEYGRSRQRAQTMLYAVVVAGIAYAAYGLIVHLGGYQMVLWFPKTAYREALTSTFINRNSYATYAALGLLCALALMFSEWRRLRAARHAGSARLADRGTRRQDHGSDLRLGALAIAVATMGAALILTGSRGGFYGLAATLAIVVVLLAVANLLRGWRLAGVIGLGAVAAVALLLATGGELAGRIERGAADVESSRGALFGPAIAAIKERPLTGYGGGSFQGVFEAVNDGTLYRQGYFIDKAHNTYLELALEAGIPAMLAMSAAILALAMLCVLALLRRRAVRFALAGLAASLMVAIHALVDFSLQMPAVAVTYAAILGVAAAQSLRRIAERR